MSLDTNTLVRSCVRRATFIAVTLLVALLISLATRSGIRAEMHSTRLHADTLSGNAYGDHSPNSLIAAEQALLLPQMRALKIPLHLTLSWPVEPFSGECEPVLLDGTFDVRAVQQLNRQAGVSFDSIAIGGSSGDRIIATVEMTAPFNDTRWVGRPYVMPASRNRLCRNLTSFSKGSAPHGGCPGDVGDVTSPHFAQRFTRFQPPWVRYDRFFFPPSEPLHIVSIACGIVSHGRAPLSVSSPSGAWSCQGKCMQASGDVVHEFDELAVPGSSPFGHAAGHFVNEALPLLLVLDRLVPLHVPLVWLDSAIGREFFHLLEAGGGLTTGRRIVWVPNKQAPVLRAKRLYMLKPAREWMQVPHETWYSQRLAGMVLGDVLQRQLVAGMDVAALADRARNRMHRVVVTRRHGGSRTLVNHDDVVARLQRELGPAFIIDAFVPGGKYGSPLLDTAARVNAAGLFIGPHGANMNNLIFLEPASASWVVEIAYASAQVFPPNFYGLSRALGFKHYLSIAVSGDHDARALLADVDDIGLIARAYRLHVESAPDAGNEPRATVPGEV